jgi:hypothetical protein
MGKLLQRNQDIARRCGDLSPLAEPVRARLVQGNREAILAGLSPDGRPVAPLKPATLKRRKGSGPPRAPEGASAKVIIDYVVTVAAGPAALRFTGTWPGFPVVEYLDRTRPTLGFRAADLEWIRTQLRKHIIPGS